MSPKKRIYQKRKRFYGDFRDYRDVGGKLEALVPEGARLRRATTDYTEAMRCLTRRVDELELLRRATGPCLESPQLKDYAVHHLSQKAAALRSESVRRDEFSLLHFLKYFGDDIRLREINVAGITDYLRWRRTQPGSRRDSSVSAATLRRELTALSSLFKRAVSEDLAELNPVVRLMDKPRIERVEPAWLEVDEAARLIAAGFKLDARPNLRRAVPFLGPLLATHLYTGGRPGEVFGLEVSDVDLVNRVVHFRPNEWRRLKRGHHRTVPLWPKLSQVLRAYLKNVPTSGLLFPSESKKMLTDIRGSLEHAVESAGIQKHVTPNTMRHTYAATRIQTLDHGQPVALFSVAKELGHAGIAMIDRHYGHLQNVRHRQKAVEYVDNELEFRREAKRA